MWDRATDIPLMVAALLFLAAYATPIISPNPRDSTHGTRK